jgi:D-alanyl-D-alanine carboxypeptidase/D-alanyl-D-alanine-endopeptidase (penicillin-binding protein 4)
MTLKQLGAVILGRGTTAAGAALVRLELRRSGIPLDGVRILDGSGLSLGDRTTSACLVALLRAAYADRAIRDAFVGSLAIAGVAGTLEDRLARRPTFARVVAKTGTTNRASALAGYVRGRYAFALVHNGSPVAAEAARAAQDRFVTVLASP